MDETTYHLLADATLDRIEAALEPAYDQGLLAELERDGSVLAIAPEGGRPLIVSKHAPTAQLWLASPRLGGLHFSRTADGWALPDGRDLLTLLEAELAERGIKATL